MVYCTDCRTCVANSWFADTVNSMRSKVLPSLRMAFCVDVTAMLNVVPGVAVVQSRTVSSVVRLSSRYFTVLGALAAAVARSLK